MDSNTKFIVYLVVAFFVIMIPVGFIMHCLGEQCAKARCPMGMVARIIDGQCICTVIPQ